MARQVSEALQVPLVQPMVLLVEPALRVSALLVRPVPQAELARPALVYKVRLEALQDPQVRLVLLVLPRARRVPRVRLAVPLVKLVLRVSVSRALRAQLVTRALQVLLALVPQVLRVRLDPRALRMAAQARQESRVLDFRVTRALPVLPA